MDKFSFDLKKMDEAAAFITALSDEKPTTCIVLGSGLGPMAEKCEILTSVKYTDIPHFPTPTTPGHEGRLLLARVGKCLTYMMQGRYHYYEGYSTADVTFPLRVLIRIGVKNLLLTNAAGGINPNLEPGDLMVITDHLSMFCESPLIGPNLDELGPRFPDQSCVYDRNFIDILLRESRRLDIPLIKGVYAYMRGPQYETPSEIKMLQRFGSDAVGMSTVPEAIVASHAGLRILALSCITNLAAGISRDPLSHKEVIEIGARASAKSISLIEAFIQNADL
jgi:purine-nucleoside phosphorylase